jgi:hypothetical protein
MEGCSGTLQKWVKPSDFKMAEYWVHAGYFVTSCRPVSFSRKTMLHGASKDIGCVASVHIGICIFTCVETRIRCRRAVALDWRVLGR